MRTELTQLYKGLLSLDGHLVEPRIDARAPASKESPMNLFKSLWLLGGLQSIDLRVGEEDELAFGPTYGNDLASRRTFGKPREADADVVPPAPRRQRGNQPRVAHC